MTKIYTLKHPDTNEVRYVGKTIQSLQHRLSGHISSACIGRLKTYGGFIWKYKNEDIV